MKHKMTKNKSEILFEVLLFYLHHLPLASKIKHLYQYWPGPLETQIKFQIAWLDFSVCYYIMGYTIICHRYQIRYSATTKKVQQTIFHWKSKNRSLRIFKNKTKLDQYLPHCPAFHLWMYHHLYHSICFQLQEYCSWLQESCTAVESQNSYNK